MGKIINIPKAPSPIKAGQDGKTYPKGFEGKITGKPK